jgi:hypothetical protein
VRKGSSRRAPDSSKEVPGSSLAKVGGANKKLNASVRDKIAPMAGLFMGHLSFDDEWLLKMFLVYINL